MAARGSSDRRVIWASIALIAVSACLGAAVALAKPGPGLGLADRVPTAAPQHATPKAAPGETRPPRPSFIEGPESTSALGETQFRFHIPPRSGRVHPQVPAPAPAPNPTQPRRRFQCRYDGEEWQACRSPHRLGAVPPGPHSFAVRALTLSGIPGSVASHAWRQVEPKPISVAAEDLVEPLSPGRPPGSTKVTLGNPNDVPVEVTRLTVAIASDPPGCPTESFRLIPSSASPGSPLPLPAGGSVSLPSGSVTAPAIEILNLPVNQDACLGAKLDLVFEAEARG